MHPSSVPTRHTGSSTRQRSTSARRLIAALLAPVLFTASAWAGTIPVTALSPIQPASTGTGITSESDSDAYDYVYVPTTASQRQNVLVVFLGGSTSTPSSYTSVTAEAASDGYGAIDLRYPDSTVIGTSCALSLTPALKNACFANERGATIFGSGVAYASGWPTWSSLGVSVTLANSVVNRLVGLLDYLVHTDTARSSYWSQFLISNGASPYATANEGPVYPNWSKIVIAGHSQGGGHAAFIAAHFSVPGAIMFSSVNDNVAGASASWVTASSVTPPARYWGLVNESDLASNGYSSAVATNWASLGGVGIGSPTDTATVQIADGAGAPLGAHRLVTIGPTCANNAIADLACHDSTAVNGAYLTDITAAWDYLFGAAGSQ